MINCAASAVATSDSPWPNAARDVQRALMASGLFKKTDPDVVSALAESVQPLSFPPQHVVFAQGDTGSCLYLIASGKVKVTYCRGYGREVVINVAGPRDIFGEVTAFDRGPREFTAVTVTQVYALAVESEQLMAWAIAYPEVGHQVMRLLARRVDLMTGCLVDFVLADPAHRLAKRLLLLSKRFGKRKGDVVRVERDLTFEEISQFAGVASASLDATLREFENRGWIRFEKHCLEIVDAQGLAALPQGSEIRRRIVD
jgi:CRP/FNR family cyclic AMP-dependent transcriptional regulator